MDDMVCRSGGCCGLCNVPNGARVLVPSLVASFALGLSACALGACEWYRIEEEYCTADDVNATTFLCRDRRVAYGLLTSQHSLSAALEDHGNSFVEELNSCQLYDPAYWSDEADQTHIVALALSSFATFLGLGASVATWLGCCWHYRKCAWGGISVCYFAAFWAQMSALVFYDTARCREAGRECLLGTGSVCSAIAGVLWVICAMSCSSLIGHRQKTRPNLAESASPKQIQRPTKILIVETVYADGTTRTQRRTTTPNGSVDTKDLDANGDPIDIDDPAASTMAFFSPAVVHTKPPPGPRGAPQARPPPPYPEKYPTVEAQEDVPPPLDNGGDDDGRGSNLMDVEASVVATPPKAGQAAAAEPLVVVPVERTTSSSSSSEEDDEVEVLEEQGVASSPEKKAEQTKEETNGGQRKGAAAEANAEAPVDEPLVKVPASPNSGGNDRVVEQLLEQTLSDEDVYEENDAHSF